MSSSQKDKVLRGKRGEDLVEQVLRERGCSTKRYANSVAGEYREDIEATCPDGVHRIEVKEAKREIPEAGGSRRGRFVMTKGASRDCYAFLQDDGERVTMDVVKAKPVDHWLKTQEGKRPKLHPRKVDEVEPCFNDMSKRSYRRGLMDDR